MKKLYSIVLMATALLIGTTAWAVDVYSWGDLQGAINAADATTETTIVLKADISTAASIDARGKNLILDLAGFDITSTAGYIIKIADGPTNDNTQRIGGKLSIINSQKITKASTISGAGWAALVQGAYDDVANFAVLKIGEGVRLTTTNNYGIVLKQASYIRTKDNKEIAYKVGYGIVVEVNGYVQAVDNALWVLGNIQAKTGNIPQVIVGGTGELAGGNNEVCLYGGGYAYYHIEGTVQGGTGIYAKAGEYEITGNAHIIATATEHTEVVPNGDGYTGGIGCGIISDSKNGYAGGMQIEISGNATIQSNTPGGYAIEEVKSDTEHSKTESLVIESGTINGNLKTTAELQENVVVNGTITGGTFNTDVTAYLSTVTGVITPVTDESGNTVYVINEKPTADPWKTTIEGASATDYVRMNNAGTVTLSADAQAKYLVMQGNDKIVIPSGKKMTVEEIVMGEDAVIEVAAGGKLIVTGAQGIVSNHASNLVLHTVEGNHAIFLMNPAVAANKHPHATVEFITNSWYDGASAYQWERFGIPTIGALKSISCDQVAGVDVYEEIAVYSNTGGWTSLGYIGGTYSIDVTQLNQPFAAYNMMAYRAQGETAPVCKMTGELVGNEDANLNAEAHWNLFANSYTAEVDLAAMLNAIKTAGTSLYPSIYLATPQGNGNYAWNAKEIEDAEDDNLKLEPMQSFILLNEGAAVVNPLNYGSMVYAPAVPGSTPAPARRAVSASENTAKLRIFVTNEEGTSDYVKFRENVNATAFEKFMNDDVNIYATADMKASIVAAEDINNSYVGFSTVKGGNFTISFANVEGREFELVDHETGARVAIAEGNTYEFTAAANSANDYRFEIVGMAKLPTAIENAEAVKSAKGIYTITGQYVGEMNVWSTLPAGIYVVNGEKLVK